MKVSKTAGVSVPFRIDPLSKSKMNWIKAHIPQVRPTGSLILRRALALYLIHIESILDDPDEFEGELTYLKAAATGDSVPWHHEPDFTQQPGKRLHEYIREINKRKIEGFLNSDPFGHIAYQKGINIK